MDNSIHSLLNYYERKFKHVWVKSGKVCVRISSFKHALNKSFFFFIILSINNISNAEIIVDSITTTASTCENNGTVTLSAESTKPNSTLLYEIITGPTITPIQNNPKFSSLFPGTYMLRIYDADFEYIDQPFTITGNYQLPDLTPVAKNPSCTGVSDGQISGQPATGKGSQPFTWELTSSTMSIIQSSDVFNNLAAGSYSIKMTDACGNYQTRVIQLTNGGSDLAHATDGVPVIYKSGCNEMIFTMQIKLLKNRAKNPLTLTLYTANGISVKTVYPTPVDTIRYVPGIYSISSSISGLTYGDYLYGCIKDNCGYEICATRDTIAPFDYSAQFNTSIVACTTKFTATISPASSPGAPYMKTGFKPPISLTLTDPVTNTRLDSTSCNQNYCSLMLKQQQPGTYQMNITDGCGTVIQKVITWPSPMILPAAVQVSIGAGCLDSTAITYFNLRNFGSATTIQILSGPTSIQSVKPGYIFSDQITYPKTFSAGLNTRYSIKNMAAGTYTYRVSDTCGNIINGTFEIKSSNLSNFTYSYSIKKGCVGDNILHFNPTSNNAVAVFIKDAQTNQNIYTRIGTLSADSIISVPAGKYIFQIYYGNAPGNASPYNGNLSNGSADCWAFTDTISIPVSSADIFNSSISILCNGTSYVEIKPDSSKGVPPYQYEISNGPKTFPLQNSNVFQLPTYGDYTIRIRDACGNSTARQITVDSSKFAPIVKIGSSCRGNKIILKAISSAFFSYEWKKPDGSLYTGDSLVINSLQPTDTGIYTVIKKVTINGCTDNFTSSYHVELHDVFTQSVSFCTGTSILIGKHIYNKSGIYNDTLKNTAGCDSILISTLSMIPKKIDTNNVRICYGENIIVGTNTYNMPGIYKDSTQNIQGCYDVTITNLDVNGFPDTLKTIICQGSSITSGSHVYTKTGLYTDTLVSSLGCDSIVTLDIMVLPLESNIITKKICEGESFVIGSNIYNQTGIYIDTLATQKCDSIITLNLTVMPYIHNAITKTICAGDNVLVGSHIYDQTGFYSDTLNTTSCDSIVTLALTVRDLPHVDLGKDTTLCFGQSLILNAGDGFASYSWNNTLSASQYISVNTAGSYWVEVTDTFGCTKNDTIRIPYVYPLPNASAGKDTTICYGKNIQLTATGGLNYIWTPGNISGATLEVRPLSTTTYHVVVSDLHQCTATDDVQLSVFPKPTPLFSETSITHCFDNNNALTLTANWGQSFLWKPSGETTQRIQVINEGTYTLTATDLNGCSYSESISVTEFCETELFVPTAFSPNGDGLNDSMKIFGKHFTAFKITIFNRWGEIIFNSTDENIQWNGMYKGEQMPIGTYPWTITYENVFDNTHTEKVLNGSVTLVR